ncbi:DUF4153 domain-containing protein [Glycomyces niveus]|uniref:DUF4173 domain-containing protein n=1 Tax=Glycomyces niveus TaxID=2820287 RepID=A0ABS3U934_9ACTN|nr:DUF4153 domain-containing protein [Glycomyces sp. NEAU-S30]MBO3734746.1 DUF4173 domain-containing protein [Glycomyces sp. NEAU-S30]
MSEPADSPAPRPEDAEASRGETPSEPPAPHRPETPMGDSRPDAEPEAVPAQAEAPPAEPAPPAPAEAPATQPAPAPAPTPAPALVAAAAHPASPVPAPHQPPAPHHPAGPLTAAQYQRQAAYYQQAHAPRMLPPNPRWHRPDAAPKPAIVVLIAVVALFGAWAAFHSTGVGIGLSLTGIAMLAVPLAAGDPKDLLPRLPGAVLVAALWSVAAIRDAGWVVFLCTAAAFLLTPLVLAPQRRFSGTAVTLAAGWLEGLAESFTWAKRGKRANEGNASMRNVWVVVITAVLLLVFGGLFAAADGTFADLVVRLLPSVNPAEFMLRIILAAVLFPLALLWAYTSVAKPRFDSQRPEGEHRTVSRFELSVPLGALNLLFVAFIAVQLRVFIGGEAYVMATNGLTFADYARRGFWQLSIVAALALGVIAVAAWLAPKRTKADRWTARILLGTLCVLSMVVIASALYRMFTYADTYGLTRMRVWIFTVEIWLAVLFALVIVCCWKLKAAWLPRAVLASGALALLGLAAANPDALIARYNLEHDHKLDLGYLEDLSDDAVPEFAGLSDADLDCMLYDQAGEERDLMAWNLGHQRASGLIKEHDEVSGSCDWGDGRLYSQEELESPAVDEEEVTGPFETVEPDVIADPPPAGFFQTENCDSIDAAQTSAWLVDEVDSWGLEPGTSDAYFSETSPNAWLTCAFYSGEVDVQGQVEYTGSANSAVNAVQNAVHGYEGGSWLIVEREDAVVLSTGSDAESQLQYYQVKDNLVIYVYVMGVSRDTVAEAAAADLAAQMADLYATFA